MRKTGILFNLREKVKRKEIKYYGLHACIKLWQMRPQDIIRLYVASQSVHFVKRYLREFAKEGRAYHIVREEELNRITESVHHEGICTVALELPQSSLSAMLVDLKNKKQATLLFLDGVQNPHNIGSILRSAAHFGVDYVVAQKIERLSPSAYRVAQGGAEMVSTLFVDHIQQLFSPLKNLGFTVVASSSHGKQSLYDHCFSDRVILIVGSETTGISKKVLSSSDHLLTIPGTDWVESLNVSTAATLLLGEIWRQKRVG